MIIQQLGTAIVFCKACQLTMSEEREDSVTKYIYTVFPL